MIHAIIDITMLFRRHGRSAGEPHIDACAQKTSRTDLDICVYRPSQ